MSRDHRRFSVFSEANTLVVRVYRVTASIPVSERFGLQAQIRRAAVSVPTNIVEGSARDSTTEYCRFLEIASARECEYLAQLCACLGFMGGDEAAALASRYEAVASKLLAARHSLKNRPDSVGR